MTAGTGVALGLAGGMGLMGLLWAGTTRLAPAPAPRASAPAQSPATSLARVEAVDVGGATFMGMKLLLPDGRAFGYVIPAGRGLVACPNFDLAALGRARIPAATAKGWAENGIHGQLRAKLVEVNLSARALGVRPGMTVEEALKLMSSPGEPRADGRRVG
jgi:uncharacterized protein YunC (DUF1805 family)